MGRLSIFWWSNRSFDVAPNGIPGGVSFSQFSAHAGANFLEVTAVGGIDFGSATRPGQYVLFLGYQPVSAVPEADTWLILAMGAGWVGWKLPQSSRWIALLRPRLLIQNRRRSVWIARSSCFPMRSPDRTGAG